MSDIFFTEMDIPPPDYNLHIGSGSHGKMTGLRLEKIETLLLNLKPDADTGEIVSAIRNIHIPADYPCLYEDGHTTEKNCRGFTKISMSTGCLNT